MVMEKQGSKKDALRTFMAARDTYTKFGLSAGGNNSKNNNSSSGHGSNSPGMNTAIRSINEICNELLSSTRNDDNDKMIIIIAVVIVIVIVIRYYRIITTVILLLCLKMMVETKMIPLVQQLSNRYGQWHLF